jgi:hypothetical protein
LLKYALVRYLALTAILPLLFLIGAKPVSGDSDFIKFDEARAVRLMHKEINRVRIDAGLRPVALDSTLSKLSREHSKDMAERDFFGHFDPEGKGANDRVRKAGFNCLVTENVGVYRADGAWLGQVVRDLMDGFLGSEMHRANILNPDITHVGIGFYQDVSGRSTIFGDEKDLWAGEGYGTIFVTQNFYRMEISGTEPALLPAEVNAGEELELSIMTVNEFDALSLHFKKEAFFSEEYFVRAEPRSANEYICRWSFPEQGSWSCKVVGVYDPTPGLARGIGQMEFVVE